MKATILVLLFISLLFNGCATPQQNNSINTKSTAKKQIIKDNTPNWINNPNKQNQICTIGTANITNIDEAKKIAFIKAKTNISKEINIHINSKSIKQINCNSKECKKSYERFSQHQSTNMLNNISVSDEYIDSKNNRYYIRACSSKTNEKFNYHKKQSKPIKNRYKTTKRSCIQQSAYPNKTLERPQHNQKDLSNPDFQIFKNISRRFASQIYIYS